MTETELESRIKELEEKFKGVEGLRQKVQELEDIEEIKKTPESVRILSGTLDGGGSG